MPITTSGIMGTDGITPVYQPEARWCFWGLHEVYVGGPGNGRYVPKINDYVIDYATYSTYIVDDIDPTTLIATLRQINPNNYSYNMSEEDILFGVGPGTQADTYRIYLDTGVIPHVLAVDARLKVGGTMCSYAKIFRGTDTSDNTKIVGRLYDQSGTLLSHNIPLELVAIDSHVNHSIKTVSVCYTNINMVDGELVTVVFYNDAGHVVSKRQLLVENTAFIRAVNSSLKYISHISMESPFSSPTTDGLIEFPMNVPLQGLNLFGILHYSDGSTLRMPVDGGKFKVFGLDQYVSTIVGQKVELTLNYTLGTNEAAYGAVSNDNKTINAPYNLITTQVEGSYTVKLFGYPVWINSISGYRMQWYLYNLDRNVVFDVTSYVSFNINSGAFNPLAYGILQRLSVSVNLRDISGSFRAYRHVQAIDIVLEHPTGDARTNWLVGYQTDSLQPMYGDNLFASALNNGSNNWTVRIDSDITTYTEWLTKMYKQTHPLFNASTELSAPTPNFFAVVCGGRRTEFPIENWNQNLNIGSGPVIDSTLFVQFFKRVPSADIQLSVAGLTIRAL